MKLIKKDKSENKTKMSRNITICTVIMVLFLIAASAVVIKAWFDGKFDSVETLKEYMSGFGVFAPVVLMLFQAIQVVIPILPGFLGCACGSVMFGVTVGFWSNYIGISLGSLAAFILAKVFGMPLLKTLFPQGRYKKWAEWASTSKSFTAFLFVAMLLPLFPDDYFCYFAGLSEMKFKRFLWIVLLGKPWCILAYSLGFSLIK